MKLYYALLKKYGTVYEIIDAREVDSEFVSFAKLYNHDFAIETTYEVYEMIKYVKTQSEKGNETGYMFFTKKDFNWKLLEKDDIQINNYLNLRKNTNTDNNSEEKDEDDINEEKFEMEKSLIIKNLFSKLNISAKNYHMIYVLEMIFLNNDFISNGYYITDDNKEDIFIDLIEKDEDGLIEKFEKLLNYKQEFNEFKELFRNVYAIKEEIEYMSFWEFNSLDEALQALENKAKEEYNVDERVLDVNKDKELIEKVRQKIKEIKLKKKESKKEVEDN